MLHLVLGYLSFESPPVYTQTFAHPAFPCYRAFPYPSYRGIPDSTLVLHPTIGPAIHSLDRPSSPWTRPSEFDFSEHKRAFWNPCGMTHPRPPENTQKRTLDNVAGRLHNKLAGKEKWNEDRQVQTMVGRPWVFPW